MGNKRFIIAGLTLALLGAPLLHNTNAAFADETNNIISAQIIKAPIELSAKQAVKMAADFATASSYVQMGGSYKEGEYKTFAYKGTTYRYLSSSIDTKKELLSYLKKTLTHHAAEKYLKDKGIIVHKGKLAQQEADGGSTLQWDKATAEFVRTDKNVKVYRLVVPVGETGEKAAYIVRYHFYPTIGYRISSEPFLDLDVPLNINPAFAFFKFLLADVNVSKQQFLNPASTAWVDEFKKGIKKVEVREMKEITRNKTQVEYAATFNVELDAGYKGQLQPGTNQLYFLIQQTGDMEFKIASYSTTPQIRK
ncbi:DL-endopeptidase inhibitor IseA family protein [Bacillus sp. FJAT-27445]|uniref:DL-endopeptidase inhibitor IseA family protein n=1 Tax=Bacillus sp. FJAT-27445 TaxID=1679166 RepID=UPI0007438B6D|nr:DL-endopeptidase inhibitor IseA family protein [Bacillus sp. FJAT-27445]